jgi:hypothetical protein
MQRSNTTLLKIVCTVLPGVAMIAAHWFPWRRLLHRDLHNLERYAIGTSAIVGTAAISISVSDGDRNDHAAMLLLAAGAAGAATALAYITDELIALRATVAQMNAENEHLHEYRTR